YPVGKYVVGSFGWRTHTICNPKVSPSIGFMPITLLPDVGSHPVSIGLGVLGMPGNTAYFGVKEILYPKAGETIAITGAAGAVGSHVGQIGKILGCRVIGFAGTDDKCQYLENELGFDRAFNYKTVNIKAALREGAPKRVDCYFDNPAIVFKELKVEGFLVNRWLDRWDEGINANMNWLREEKIKYKEKVYHGFDNMVEALVGILRGENTGKAVVKVK
ncbi:hypothetical protein MSG28_010352, partial [Choristoneura fumiferana]